MRKNILLNLCACDAKTKKNNELESRMQSIQNFIMHILELYFRISPYDALGSFYFYYQEITKSELYIVSDVPKEISKLYALFLEKCTISETISIDILL